MLDLSIFKDPILNYSFFISQFYAPDAFRYNPDGRCARPEKVMFLFVISLYGVDPF